MDLKKEKSTGLLEIPGELTGEKKVISDSLLEKESVVLTHMLSLLNWHKFIICLDSLINY